MFLSKKQICNADKYLKFWNAYRSDPISQSILTKLRQAKTSGQHRCAGIGGRLPQAGRPNRPRYAHRFGQSHQCDVIVGARRLVARMHGDRRNRMLALRLLVEQIVHADAHHIRWAAPNAMGGRHNVLVADQRSAAPPGDVAVVAVRPAEGGHVREFGGPGAFAADHVDVNGAAVDVGAAHSLREADGQHGLVAIALWWWDFGGHSSILD